MQYYKKNFNSVMKISITKNSKKLIKNSKAKNQSRDIMKL